jgi:hypothetical protein
VTQTSRTELVSIGGADTPTPIASSSATTSLPSATNRPPSSSSASSSSLSSSPTSPAGNGSELTEITPATVSVGAERVTEPTVDVGDVCIESYDAEHLDEFLSTAHGAFQGADYQRAFELGDGRTLWVFQDAFLSDRLVHNGAMVQQGRCFTLLNDGTHNWILDDITRPLSDWWWILDANHDRDHGRIELVVADMIETGPAFLARTRVRRTVVVTIDDRTFDVITVSDTFDANPDVASGIESGRFYGWAVVDDADDGYRYLYSHCYAQFGFDNVLGIPCSADMYLARVAGTSILGTREYWTGSSWSPAPTTAAPIFGPTLTVSGNNPGSVRYDRTTGLFHLVLAVDDWWSNRVVFATSPDPHGPWTVTGTEELTPRCTGCNTYYASWAPTTDTGEMIWTISNNHWDTPHTTYYFPSAHPYRFAP